MGGRKRRYKEHYKVGEKSLTSMWETYTHEH